MTLVNLWRCVFHRGCRLGDFVHGRPRSVCPGRLGRWDPIGLRADFVDHDKRPRLAGARLGIYLDRFVTLPWGEREVSASQELSGVLVWLGVDRHLEDLTLSVDDPLRGRPFGH